MGLLDLFKGKFVDPTYPGVHGGGNVITTTLNAVVRWGRRSSIWPMPFGTACCAIEFMAMSASHYDIARFGAEVLRFSPRQSDLLFVAGTIPDKLGPVLRTIYEQMPEPKWVISMGVCASSGRLLPLVPRHAGDRRDHARRRLRARLPPVARGPHRRGDEDPGEDQERRAGEARPRAPTAWAPPARAPSTGAPGARPGRRTTPPGRRRASHPAGVLSLPVIQESNEDVHHG